MDWKIEWKKNEGEKWIEFSLNHPPKPSILIELYFRFLP